MQRSRRLFLVPLLALAACGADPAADALGHVADAARSSDARVSSRTLLEAERMVGVPRPYTGPDNAIRGIAGGGVPWAVLGEAEAKLLEDGRLEVKVEGLVFDPNDADAISRGIAGTNTVAQMKAILSCQTVTDGAATIANVSTALFPATTGAAAAGGGNVHIVEQLALPSPCIAPIVFVTSPAGA
jgi:hypothetical protein